MSKFPLLGLSLLLLTACAGIEPGNAPAPGAEQDTTADELVPEAASKAQEQLEQQIREIPERPLDQETMARLMEAEFSLYRQDPATALKIYEQLTASTGDAGVARRSAEIALTSNDPFRTLDAALAYLELAPDSTHAQKIAARALTRAAEVEGAWELIQAQPEPERAEILQSMAVEAVRTSSQNRDQSQVKWLLEKILQVYGESPDAIDISLALAILYENLSDFDQAARYAAEVNRARPDNLLAVRLRANALVRSGNLQAASDMLSHWIRHNIDEAEPRFSLAQILASFDRKAALPIFEELSEEYPWVGQLRLGAAQLHLANGSPENAIPHYERLSSLSEYREMALFNLGRIYEQRDEREKAADYFKQVTDENLIFEARARRALIRYSPGAEQALDEEFNDLRNSFPERAQDLFQEQGTTLLTADALEPAIDAFTRGLEQYPDSEAMLYSRSIAYERTDRVEEAVADLRKILSFDEDNATALNALGYTLANRTTEFDEAQELIERAMELDPEDPAIIDSMGWVLYRKGEHNKALEYLQLAYDNLLDEEVVVHWSRYCGNWIALMKPEQFWTRPNRTCLAVNSSNRFATGFNYTPILINAMPIRRALVICVALVLSACETFSVIPQEPTGTESSQENWRIRGKFSFRSEQVSESGNFDWQQHGDRYQVRLFGPLGIGAVTISGDSDQVRIRTRDQDLISQQPQQTLRELTGMNIPINSLNYWLLGQRTDSNGTDANGTEREDSGWTLTYTEPKLFQAVVQDTSTTRELATRIVGHNGPHQLKLAIKSWTPL